MGRKCYFLRAVLIEAPSEQSHGISVRDGCSGQIFENSDGLSQGLGRRRDE